MLSTTQKTNKIEAILKQELPDATIKIESAGDDSAKVRATIQGPFNGSKLLKILNQVDTNTIPFSIYRSGTGLTLRFDVVSELQLA